MEKCMGLCDRPLSLSLSSVARILVQGAKHLWIRKLNISFMISPDSSMSVYAYLFIKWQNKRKLSQNLLNYRFRFKCILFI